MSTTVASYSQTAEGLAAARAARATATQGVVRLVEAEPSWDLTKLKKAANRSISLANPGGSPGCTPVLREILLQSGLAHAIDAEVVLDGDALGHQGGNALDVRGLDADGTKKIADLLYQMPTFFNLVGHTDADGIQTIVWLGDQDNSFHSGLTRFISRCLDHVHVASTFTRLVAALGADVPPDITQPEMEFGVQASSGIPVDGQVYITPVGDADAAIDGQQAVL